MKITKQLLISNTFWPGVARCLVMLLNLVALPLFISRLGADLFGIWVIANVALGMLGVFDFGFTQGLQKFVADARAKEDHTELSEVVMTGLGILLLLGLLLGVGCFILAGQISDFFSIRPEHRNAAVGLLRITGLFCIISWPLRIVDVVLLAGMRIKELSFLTAFRNVSETAIMVALIYASKDIVVIKWITTSAGVLCSAFGLLLVKKYVPEIVWSPRGFKWSQLKRMHKFSLGMFLSALIAMFSVQIDSIIVGHFMTMGAVTAYAVAAKPFQLIQQLVGLVIQAVTPASYTLWAQNDLKRIEQLLSQVGRIRTIVTLPLCIVFYVCMPDFIHLWVGDAYADTVKWARCFMLVPIWACLGTGANVCIAAGGLFMVNVLAGIRIFSNLVISVLLIRTLGIGGPILGTVISNMVLGGAVLYYVFCRRIGVRSVRGYHYYFQILVISLLAGLLGYALAEWIQVKSWGGLVFKVAVILIPQVFFICVWGTTKAEKTHAVSWLKSIRGTGHQA